MFMLHGHEKGHAKLPMSMSAFIFIFIFMLHEHENDHGQRHGYGHRSENQRFWCRISNSGKILIRYLIEYRIPLSSVRYPKFQSRLRLISFITDIWISAHLCQSAETPGFNLWLISFAPI
jgi:hypothetical protein